MLTTCTSSCRNVHVPTPPCPSPAAAPVRWSPSLVVVVPHARAIVVVVVVVDDDDSRFSPPWRHWRRRRWGRASCCHLLKGRRCPRARKLCTSTSRIKKNQHRNTKETDTNKQPCTWLAVKAQRDKTRTSTCRNVHIAYNLFTRALTGYRTTL